ncbi:MAG: hypothetical protein H7A37_05470 [Chlamydiales bacterium]|nr:hypothetical protein [Chlamydiales bacterium]MCP5507729.1 hypothetical protein [Chlamydiales bacterium]
MTFNVDTTRHPDYVSALSQLMTPKKKIISEEMQSYLDNIPLKESADFNLSASDYCDSSRFSSSCSFSEKTPAKNEQTVEIAKSAFGLNAERAIYNLFE